ncbi:Dedicator of cytokinesis protein 3 [Operophtera brumata]|uniref:Dedicator of cytokinesis protein 3 n=1 Tax=Operophtera brumata TaxID=104452 RepID=A0A0L7KXK9_OPEBR|nr:Dedicator of cytokinesis protein 3 [Operophtera brumata]
MWIPLKSTKLAVAVYNWKGDVRSGLPLEIGEAVQLLEENGGESFIYLEKFVWAVILAFELKIRLLCCLLPHVLLQCLVS